MKNSYQQSERRVESRLQCRAGSLCHLPQLPVSTQVCLLLPLQLTVFVLLTYILYDVIRVLSSWVHSHHWGLDREVTMVQVHDTYLLHGISCFLWRRCWVKGTYGFSVSTERQGMWGERNCSNFKMTTGVSEPWTYRLAVWCSNHRATAPHNKMCV